jgi:hypothetical protein
VKQLEAALDALQLGSAMKRAAEIRDLGAPIDATRRSRVGVVGFSAFAVALTLTGVAGIIATLADMIRIGQFNDGIAVRLGACAFFLVLATILAFIVRRLARDFIAIYEYGMLFDISGKRRLVRWEEMYALHKEVFDIVSDFERRPRDTYRLQLGDGTIFKWDFDFERHREIGQCCEAMLARSRGYAYPRA